jgi:hypothetical protein
MLNQKGKKFIYDLDSRFRGNDKPSKRQLNYYEKYLYPHRSPFFLNSIRYFVINAS